MLNVSLEGGMQEEYFAASQSIIETKISGRDKPYFQRKEKAPLKLTVNFAFEEHWDEKELNFIRRWLSEPEYYVPLTFSNNNEKIYYVLYEDEPMLVHNSLRQGYITINFRCNDSYAFSPITYKPNVDDFYNWDSGIENILVNDFTNGTHNQTIVENDKLTLSSDTVRWRDLPLHLTWREILNQ
jgi:putative phage tail component, N-terminal domain